MDDFTLTRIVTLFICALALLAIKKHETFHFKPLVRKTLIAILCAGVFWGGLTLILTSI
jgi:hypothetical protein